MSAWALQRSRHVVLLEGRRAAKYALSLPDIVIDHPQGCRRRGIAHRWPTGCGCLGGITRQNLGYMDA